LLLLAPTEFGLGMLYDNITCLGLPQRTPGQVTGERGFNVIVLIVIVLVVVQEFILFSNQENHHKCMIVPTPSKEFALNMFL
jgi:hypothetical protein